MQHFFGRIENGKMDLSDEGILARQFWLEIPQHFKNASLDEFIIMPNHIHGILILSSQNPAQTAHSAVSPNDKTGFLNNETTPCAVSAMKTIQPKPGSLSVIVGSYKSVVTKFVRKLNPEFRWQERYHDWIIRSDRHFENTQKYIRENPSNWKKDKTRATSFD